VQVKKGDMIQIWDWSSAKPAERIFFHGRYGLVLGLAKRGQSGYKLINFGEVFKVLTTNGERILVHKDNMKAVQCNTCL